MVLTGLVKRRRNPHNLGFGHLQTQAHIRHNHANARHYRSFPRTANGTILTNGTYWIQLDD